MVPDAEVWRVEPPFSVAIKTDELRHVPKSLTPWCTSRKIDQDDLKQRYVEKIPQDFGKMAELKWLGYTSPQEMLGERFHIDQSLLERLNPNADFTSVGTELQVPAVRENAGEKVTRIIVDRSDAPAIARLAPSSRKDHVGLAATGV